MDPSRLLPRPSLSGAPVALPPLLDRLSERWWSLPPRLRAVLLAVVVVLALAVVGRGATRSPWGAPTDVLVATSDLAAGSPLTTAETRTARRPAGLLPPDVLVDPAQLPDDARVQAPVAAGTVLSRRLVAAGVAGLLDQGEAAVAVPRDGLPALDTGQVVDVVATDVHGTGTRLAEAARVVAADPDWVWLAVPGGRVDAVAGAGAAGRLQLAVRPPG